MKSSALFACAGLALCAGLAAAKPALQPYHGPVTQVQPNGVARVTYVNGQMHIGKVHRLDGGVSPAAYTNLVFDSGSFDETTGEPVPCDNLFYFFGEDYDIASSVNDIASYKGGQTPATIEELGWVWYNNTEFDLNPTVLPPGTEFAIVIQFWNLGSGDCTPRAGAPDGIVAAEGFVDSVLFTYAALPSPAGAYSSNTGGLGLPFTLAAPPAGGAVQMLIGAFDAATNSLFLLENVQPMFSQQSPTEGTSAANQWDDDFPADGVFTAPDECYDYDYGAIDPCYSATLPWGTAVALWAPAAGPTCRVDFNSDGELTFDDIQLFIQLFNANDNRADLNSDQEWTFDDIQLFISLFNAGC
jgi:hypothetical protein